MLSLVLGIAGYVKSYFLSVIHASAALVWQFGRTNCIQPCFFVCAKIMYTTISVSDYCDSNLEHCNLSLHSREKVHLELWELDWLQKLSGDPLRKLSFSEMIRQDKVTTQIFTHVENFLELHSCQLFHTHPHTHTDDLFCTEWDRYS